MEYKFKSGFDLTDFGNVKVFKTVLTMLNASKEVKFNSKLECFEWEGANGKVVTANNPISGEYARKGERPKEVGYASYMRIETNSKTAMDSICGFINENAEYVKGFTPYKARFI